MGVNGAWNPPQLPASEADAGLRASQKNAVKPKPTSSELTLLKRSGPYRVMFLIPSLDYGGAERQLVELVKGLDKRKFQPTVVTLQDAGPLKRELGGVDAIRVVSLDRRRGERDVQFIWRLIAVARSLQPHIVHGYMNFSNLLALLAGKAVKATVVWGIRGSNNRELPQFDRFERVWFHLARRVSRHSDLIVFNSRAGRDYFRAQGFRCRRSIVVPNGIDCARFTRRLDLRDQVRAEWGVARSELLIGLVARLDPVKEHPLFLSAAARLAQRRDDLRFVCVGSGAEDYASRLRQMAVDFGLSGRIIWAGSRNDMAAVHNALDISMSCSTFGEGFPNAIGESMACGVPCVVAGAGDTEWIVGDTGAVAAQGDTEALARACETLLRRLDSGGDTLRQRCRVRIVEHFSLARLVEKTEAELLGLMQSSAVHRTTRQARSSHT